MAFTESLSAFFSVDEFAISATIDGTPVAGILNSGFDGATLDGYGTAGSSPVFTLPSTNVPAHAEGKALVIATGHGAGSYRIGAALPDGTGLTDLHLVLQSST